MPLSSSVPSGIRMYHNLLLSLLAAVIPWSLQTNLVVVSWAFFELVVSSCFMSIALFTFTFFSILILIHSALALPARSFHSVVHHPVARSLATPPARRYLVMLVFCLSLVHHSPCLASPLFL